MQRLILQQEGEWVRLLGDTSRPFVEFLKYGVKPQTYRRYDTVTKVWMVHWRQLPVVTSAARKFYHHVDWSSLPPEWQMLVAGADVDLHAPVIPADQSPFAELFITEDAPLDVVKAAYKALAGIYHPDHGGTEMQMARLNSAYTKVRQLKDH